MAELNKVLLIGNIEGKANIVAGEGGNTVIEFKLVTKAFYFKDGEKKYNDVQHAIRFATKYTKIAEYLVNGKLLYVEGSIRTEPANGFYIEAYNVQLLGGSISSGKSSGYVGGGFTPRADDDDLPY